MEKQRVLAHRLVLFALASFIATFFFSRLLGAEEVKPQEVGTVKKGGLEITLVIVPPMTKEAQARMMKMREKRGRKMGERKEMKPTAMKPTHELGVIIEKEAERGTMVRDMKVSVTAVKGQKKVQFMMRGMMGCGYHGPISLPEKGHYRMVVRMESKGKRPVEAEFEWEYR